ncbi:MAG: hypothetical protein IPH12_01665 [Saprospirales bacterium]|nr:hypothetical protein [Saprospirales bacterium]
MEQTPSTSTDLQHRLLRLQCLQQEMRPRLRGRWIRAIVRWALTVALYIAFWEYHWVRVSLYFVLPLALINSLFLASLTWLLPRAITRLERQIQAAGPAD